MKRSLITAALAMLVCSSVNAQTSPNLSDIAKRYMAAKNAVQQKDSTKQDIENMVAFMRDDIQTEHKPYKLLECKNDGDGKEGFRRGLSYYLGKYESSKTEILDITEGQNMVAVKFLETIEFEKDGKIVSDTSKQLFILEFKDGLISQELRYDL